MGVACIEVIGKACCIFGAGHLIGPFQLQDLTGIDLPL
jgi:3-hydroxyacyl-CoA dehydrogenase